VIEARCERAILHQDHANATPTDTDWFASLLTPF